MKGFWNMIDSFTESVLEIIWFELLFMIIQLYDILYIC